MINHPRLFDSCSWIPRNNLLASVRLTKVIPINADIRNKDSRKRLGAIFLNIGVSLLKKLKEYDSLKIKAIFFIFTYNFPFQLLWSGYDV